MINFNMKYKQQQQQRIKNKEVIKQEYKTKLMTLLSCSCGASY